MLREDRSRKQKKKRKTKAKIKTEYGYRRRPSLLGQSFVCFLISELWSCQYAAATEGVVGTRVDDVRNQEVSSSILGAR